MYFFPSFSIFSMFIAFFPISFCLVLLFLFHSFLFHSTFFFILPFFHFLISFSVLFSSNFPSLLTLYLSSELFFFFLFLSAPLLFFMSFISLLPLSISCTPFSSCSSFVLSIHSFLLFCLPTIFHCYSSSITVSLFHFLLFATSITFYSFFSLLSFFIQLYYFLFPFLICLSRSGLSNLYFISFSSPPHSFLFCSSYSFLSSFLRILSLYSALLFHLYSPPFL